ncbi:MAG: hypothetical protein WD036_02995, partial [Bauldia sp.]
MSLAAWARCISRSQHQSPARNPVSNGTAARSGNRLVFSAVDATNRPMVSRSFTRVSSGEVAWAFEFDWTRTGSEGTYRLFMQLGDSGLMSANNWDAGVAVNLV